MKEFLHQRAAFVREDTALDLNSMIQFLRNAYPKMSANSAETFIVCAINQSFDAGIDQSAGAHRAGLYRCVNRGSD